MSWSRRKIEGHCSVDGCDQPLKAKGLCANHYQMNRKHGRTHPILNHYPEGTQCLQPGCKNRVIAFGYCTTHYKSARKSGVLHAGKYTRDHPLYALWWHRRKLGILAEEWKENFARFAADIGQKPGDNFSLVTLHDGPFAPDNFKWREELRRRDGESRKAYKARKWQAQMHARPSWDRNRRILKTYGITPAEYERMSLQQRGVCAICAQPETSINARGSINSLGVDHCHKTGKVRELLCIRCNSTIGRVGESIDILHAMIRYLEKHSQPKETSP
jgi:Autographiviridae endonuclease VII